MAKKRTKAQRSAAAKASWARRREAALNVVKQHVQHPNEAPDKTQAMSVLSGMPLIDGPLADTFAPSRIVAQAIADDHLTGSYAIPAVVKEGHSFYLHMSQNDGGYSRQRISEEGARKLFKELGAILL